MTKKITTKMVGTVGLLVAVHVVLSRFCSINAWNIKIGFAFVPIFVAAYLYGPLMAGVVGALGDFVGAIAVPIGMYFPGFTVTCFLTGVIFGLLLHKKQTAPHILGAVIVNQLVLGLLLNTLWISILYGAPYRSLLVTRIVQSAILIPVEFLTIGFVMRTLFHRRRGVIS